MFTYDLIVEKVKKKKRKVVMDDVKEQLEIVFSGNTSKFNN